jgi:uncharacterized protein YjbJ (UPF0337 family)
MNWDQMQGKWTQMRGGIKAKWGKLTDSDLDVIAGNRDKLLGKIQERYGKSKEDAERQIDEWQRTFAHEEPVHHGD